MKSVQPKNMKWHNERLIIEYLLKKSVAAKSEIAEATGMSVTTVRTQLKSLIERKAVCTFGDPESLGGRPAEKYTLTDSFAPILYVAFGFEKTELTILSMTGKLLLEKTIPTELLDEEVAALLSNKPQIDLVEISVPGIPIKKGFLYGENLEEGNSYSFGFLDDLPSNISIEILNDLNLCAIGELKNYPEVNHLVYLSFSGCAGTGIIIDRKLYTGHQAFAGELGMLSYEDKLIDEWLNSPDEKERSKVIQFVLELISLTLSPEVLVFSESKLPQEKILQIVSNLQNKLWAEPKIVFKDSKKQNGLSGAHHQAIDLFLKKGWEEA